MSGLDYVRWRFWDPERYTDAQALQLRQLRALYTTHLAPVFGPKLPDAFRLRSDGDEHYPALTSTALLPPSTLSQPPISGGARPLKPFADTLLTTLAVFEASRARRWVGKGHPNDPTRLLGVWIREISSQWLTHAPLNATTLAQVTALRQYVEALTRDPAWTQDGHDQGSMLVLLHNVSTPLRLLEQRLQREIRLQSAREHFGELKAQVAQALDTASHYLFVALAEQDRTGLPFSLINVQAGVISRPLEKALQTREGCLLKQWLLSPLLRHAFLSGPELKTTAVSESKPLSLLGTERPTPLLEEDGRVSADWLAFLQRDSALEEQWPSALRCLPLGICPGLQSHSGLLAQAIQCHGFLALLSEYQFYLHQCWQLAGFGGDHCVYDQMATAITSILGELQVFNEGVMRHVGVFQAELDRQYAQALAGGLHLEWQANYRLAKASQEELLAQLRACETHLAQLLAHAQDRQARVERQAMAEQAYQTLRHAPDFLNRARQQLGLAPRLEYPGLVSPAAPRIAASAEVLADIRWEQVTGIFLSSSPEAAAWLGVMCQQTAPQAPWRVFRGSYRRHSYLQGDRLKRLYQSLLDIQHGNTTPLTPEKRTLIERCQVQLREEQARIRQLQQGLWWPFHQASIGFFNAWERGIIEKLSHLDRLQQAGDRPSSTELLTIARERKEMLTQPVRPAEEAKDVILLPASGPQEGSAQAIQAALARGQTLLAQARETTRRLEKQQTAATRETKVSERVASVDLPSESKAKSVETDPALAADALLPAHMSVRTPIETKAIASKKSLSPGTRERIVSMGAQYIQLKSTERGTFDAWQQNHFGCILFDGSSYDHLTEEEGVALFDQWIQLRIEIAQSRLLSYEATAQQFQTNFLTEEESNHVRAT